MNHLTSILLLHFATVCYMTGVIWLVQLVLYPRLDTVPEDRFPEVHRRYMHVMGFVVGPAMVIELLTGTLLSTLLIRDNIGIVHLNMALLFVIWISTFALQVPCHSRLARGFDAKAHARLVQTNWIRTVAWTARVPLVGTCIVTGVGLS